MNRASILSAYIDEVERQPFAYGVNDCLLMVAGAVERITGVDHAAAYRGRYTTLAGGKRVIGMSPLEFVASKLPEIHPSLAADGDVAVLLQDGEWAFGLFLGPFIYAQSKSGIGILSRGDAIKAFRVE